MKSLILVSTLLLCLNSFAQEIIGGPKDEFKKVSVSYKMRDTNDFTSSLGYVYLTRSDNKAETFMRCGRNGGYINNRNRFNEAYDYRFSLGRACSAAARCLLDGGEITITFSTEDFVIDTVKLGEKCTLEDWVYEGELAPEYI